MPSIAETDPDEYNELLSRLDLGSEGLDCNKLNPSIAVAAAQLNASLERSRDPVSDTTMPPLEPLVGEGSTLHDLD